MTTTTDRHIDTATQTTIREALTDARQAIINIWLDMDHGINPSPEAIYDALTAVQAAIYDRRGGNHPAPFVHRMTGSSTVRCGWPMRDHLHPDGWDRGNATPDGFIDCPSCVGRATWREKPGAIAAAAARLEGK